MLQPMSPPAFRLLDNDAIPHILFRFQPPLRRAFPHPSSTFHLPLTISTSRASTFFPPHGSAPPSLSTSAVSLLPPALKKPEIITWSEEMPVNSATFIGTLGRDVDIRYLDSGRVVATTSIKVKRRPQEYSWFLVEFWGDLAEIASAYLKKDSHVFISGSVYVETFFGDDGLERTLCKVIVKTWKLVQSTLASAKAMDNSQVSAEELWQNVFDNPCHWWDNRLEKKSRRHPDFKHKLFNHALWIDNYSTPSWVKERLIGDSLKKL